MSASTASASDRTGSIRSVLVSPRTPRLETNLMTCTGPPERRARPFQAAKVFTAAILFTTNEKSF